MNKYRIAELKLALGDPRAIVDLASGKVGEHPDASRAWIESSSALEEE